MLGLLVAYGGLVVVVVNQRQDAEDRKARHKQLVDLLEKDIAARGEGNRLLGQLIDIQKKR